MILLVLASAIIAVVPDHRLHLDPVMENPSRRCHVLRPFAADHQRRWKGAHMRIGGGAEEENAPVGCDDNGV
jgi:hypothetical protein